MDVLGVRILVSPAGTAAALAAVSAGVALGTCSGLVPGLHVNTLALLLAAAAPLAPGPPHLVGAALLAVFRGAGVPEQDDPGVAVSARQVVQPGVAGSLAGAAVAYVPGVSGAIAALFALDLTRADGDRTFVAELSGVNTANTVFALFALGSPRTGVLVAFERASLPRTLPLLLASVALAAVAAAAMVPVLGDRYFRLVRAVDHRRLTAGVCVLLVVLAWLFAGVTGVALLAAATLVGLIPPAFGARRVHLMAVLLVPIALQIG